MHVIWFDLSQALFAACDEKKPKAACVSVRCGAHPETTQESEKCFNRGVLPKVGVTLKNILASPRGVVGFCSRLVARRPGPMTQSPAATTAVARFPSHRAPTR